jgi:hypothetical protein
MAHAEALPEEVLDKVLEQVGVLLRGAFDSEQLSGAEVGLGETFDVWVLEADAVIRPTDDLRLLANPTGRWHHQVSVNGVVEAFARSVPLGATPDSWRVVEVFKSPLASKIDKAIVRVDDLHIVGDPLARLLIVPAYQVHAFWLLNDKNVEQVLVIDRPEQFIHLHADQLLSYHEFLEALRREQHIIGRIRS